MIYLYTRIKGNIHNDIISPSAASVHPKSKQNQKRARIEKNQSVLIPTCSLHEKQLPASSTYKTSAHPILEYEYILSKSRSFNFYSCSCACFGLYHQPQDSPALRHTFLTKRQMLQGPQPSLEPQERGPAKRYFTRHRSRGLISSSYSHFQTPNSSFGPFSLPKPLHSFFSPHRSQATDFQIGSQSTSAMEDAREYFDNLVWDKNDEEWEETPLELRQRSTIRLVEALATEKFGCPSTWITPMNIGGYNIVYRLRVKGFCSDVIVRRPIPCWAQSPEEKTSIEAATVSYIEKQTQIPVAPVLFHGKTSELGYYLIIKYVKHQYSMSTALNATNDDTDKTFVLDPNISADVLEDLYGKVASCLLELSPAYISSHWFLGRV